MEESSPTCVPAATETHVGLRRDRFLVFTIWLMGVAVAGFLAFMMRDSAMVDGVYIPRTTDSLYHAHRILDAAVGERGFYQFDERLHVPEGAWISWPWGYDYLMAKATQVAVWLKPGLDPMAFLIYVAPAWIAVNAALFLAATGSLRLSMGMRALAMLCFALSPLTQILHAAGQIDHHFVELTFILFNVWLGLRWFEQPHRLKWPIALGATLGISQSFHIGLFLLQLAPLTCVFLLWLRGRAPAPRSLLAFCISLLCATQLVLVPSEAYREGMFEFGLLSWFHFYVAFSTSAAIAFMAWRPATWRTICAVILLGLALSLPLHVEVLHGAAFLSRDFSILDTIGEARSPYNFAQRNGWDVTIGLYSWLLFLAPVFLLLFIFRVITERRPVWVFYGTTSVLGLALLLTQFRFHYYGTFALFTAGLVIVERTRERFGLHRGLVFAGTLALIAAAYQPALRERLFAVHYPGSDPEYANTWPLFRDLSELCAEDPGVVLASNDDGNAVLFHTECSVIANNFILRDEDARKINEVRRLMRGTPRFIRENRPDIKYIIIRSDDFSPGGKIDRRFPIARQLLIDEVPPEGFELVGTVFSTDKPEGPDDIYARLYRIVR